MGGDVASDSRNLIDGLKGRSESEIVDLLDQNGVELEIAIENLERDFNMGTIVRSANAFGVRHIHVIGRKQWNKRGAMMTDKYLHVHYHPSPRDFEAYAKQNLKVIIAVDNVNNASPLSESALPLNAVLVFGAEGPGLSAELQAMAVDTVAIEQFGSTRSVNVGVAAGIVMYQWLRTHRLH